jgi:hypothetical protein
MQAGCSPGLVRSRTTCRLRCSSLRSNTSRSDLGLPSGHGASIAFSDVRRAARPSDDEGEQFNGSKTDDQEYKSYRVMFEPNRHDVRQILEPRPGLLAHARSPTAPRGNAVCRHGLRGDGNTGRYFNSVPHHPVSPSSPEYLDQNFSRCFAGRDGVMKPVCASLRGWI